MQKLFTICNIGSVSVAQQRLQRKTNSNPMQCEHLSNNTLHLLVTVKT